jgi:WhiB family redox-sensing transcriptional regulator
MTVTGRATTDATQGDSPRTNRDWRTSAACRREDPELFFPAWGDSEKTVAAKAVCARCEVRPSCLQWAMSTQQAGVWGGLTEQERQQIGQRRSPTYKHDVLLINWGSSAPDDAQVRSYLDGTNESVSLEARFAAVVRGVRSGKTYRQFDALYMLPDGATAAFMSVVKKAHAAQEVPFPELGRRPGVRVMTNEQAAEYRQRAAAGGVTDGQLAHEAGVHRKAMSKVLSGLTYQTAGGPVRDPKTRQYPPAVVWASGAEAHGADSDRMETAA